MTDEVIIIAESIMAAVTIGLFTFAIHYGNKSNDWDKYYEEEHRE